MSVKVSNNRRVVLVTGGSSGFGKACVYHLARLGHRVYGTSRRVAFPSDEGSVRLPLIIPMDVRETSSVEAALAYVLKREGRLDVLVNNAGVALAGSIEETSIEEAKAQFETNFFGVHRVCRSVVPTMRQQGSGLIVNIGSLAGQVAVPFQGIYCASKCALMALTESLRMEVRPFGVQVTLFEPGDFKTPLTTNRSIAAESRHASDYRDRQCAAIGVIERDEQNGADPGQLAVLLGRTIDAQRVRPSYRSGMFFQRFAVGAKRMLPASLFEKLIMAYYGI